MRRPAPAAGTVYRVEIMLDRHRRPCQINGTKLGPDWEPVSIIVRPLDPKEWALTLPDVSMLAEFLDDLDVHTGVQAELWDLTEDSGDYDAVTVLWDGPDGPAPRSLAP